MSFAKRLSIFKFPNPDQWYCYVSHYMVGHSELHIKAQQSVSGEVLTIVFIATIYFEGPLAWRGANFLLEPQEECEALMEKVGETSTEILLESKRLFSSHISKAPDLNTKVRVVAGVSAFVTDKNVSVT